MSFTIPTIFTAIDKFSAPVRKMTDNLSTFNSKAARFERGLRRTSETAKKIAVGTGIAATAILTPLAAAANEAVKFEDRMADSAKTIKDITPKELNALGDAILRISENTRTSIEELQDISRIGGQMGIAKDKIEDFIIAADKFNVALGSDFEGGTEQAVTSVAKLQSLFKETRDLDISDSITKAGSVINALSAEGKASAGNITEFLLRLGALPDAIKPTIQNAAALGTVLEESGIDAEVGARAVGILLTTAGENIGAFANQMGLAQTEAEKLLSTDPTKFAGSFAKSLKNLNATELAIALKKLKIGSDGVIKVVGALGSNVDRLNVVQEASNKEFALGTSLLNEYNTKNETSAANIAKFKNQIRALSIEVGNELLPVIADLLKMVTPLIKGFVDWTKENPKLFKQIVKGTAVVGALLLAISAVSTVISVVTGAVAAWGVVTKIAAFATAAWNTAMVALEITAFALGAPIWLVVAGIVAMIAVVSIIIAKYDEWGAAASLALGFISMPLMLIINLIQSFRRNWDMLVDTFRNGDLLDILNAISAVILDSILYPIEQLLSLLAEWTGFDWLDAAKSSITDFRGYLGIDTEKPVVDNQEARNESLSQRIMMNQKATLNITGDTRNANLEEDTGGFVNFNLPSSTLLSGGGGDW